MLPAFLTAALFSFSSVCASRSARLIGSLKSNIYRLVFAFLCLTLYAYVWGKGHQGPGLEWFFLSGAVGVGVGDMFVFQAIRRIGPRLTMMLVQCLAAPFGALLEWLWLGTTLTPFQFSGGVVILFGSVLALMPEKEIRIAPRILRAGILSGILGALGQALGAVITRKANEVNLAAHIDINGITAAYQRMLGGLVVGLLIYFAIDLFLRHQKKQYTFPAAIYKKAAPWVMLNAVAGLVLGVSCYQWALQHTPTGIVLAVVATTPLLVMPMAYLIDNDRPSRRALLGGVMAVVGVLIIKFYG